jgi:hypothetical protein
VVDLSEEDRCHLGGGLRSPPYSECVHTFRDGPHPKIITQADVASNVARYLATRIPSTLMGREPGGTSPGSQVPEAGSWKARSPSSPTGRRRLTFGALKSLQRRDLTTIKNLANQSTKLSSDASPATARAHSHWLSASRPRHGATYCHLCRWDLLGPWTPDSHRGMFEPDR